MAEAYRSEAYKTHLPCPIAIYPSAYEHYTDYYSEKEESTFRISKDIWEHIPRNTYKTKTLTDTAIKLISIIHALINNSPDQVTYFSLEYLCTKLNITDRQLRTVRKEIAHIFSSKWKKAVKVNSSIKKSVYLFKYTARGKIILDAPNKYYRSIKLGSQLPTSIYRDENIKEYRSIAQAHGSIFYNNSNSLIKTESTKFVETEKTVSVEEVIVSKAPIEATTVKLQRFKKRRPNQRKKTTNSIIKAKIIKLVPYSKPKSLADMHLLLDQPIFDELRSKSGREFSNNFISQLVLAMSKKPKLANTNFKTRNGFIAYMSLALRYELHDAVKAGNVDFRLLANVTAEDKAYQEQERFLTEIENSRTVNSEWHFKKKLVSVLSRSKAYALLQSYKFLEVSNEVLRIHLARCIELTELEKEIILDQAKATHERMNGDVMEIIQTVEFIISEQEQTSVMSQLDISTQIGCSKIKLSEGVWGGICKQLIAEYGMDTYRNWFSKLSVEIQEEVGVIELKTQGEFTMCWIQDKYLDFLVSIAKGIGFNLKLFR